MTFINLSFPSKIEQLTSSQTITIDCGSTSTKLLCFNFNSEKKIQFFRMLTSELRQNLQKLSENVITLSKDHKINVCITGIHSSYAEAIVSSLWSSKVTLVDELRALSKGLEILANNVDELDVSYTDVVEEEDENVFKVDENNEFIKRFYARMNSSLMKSKVIEDGKLIKPSIIMWAGASVKFYFWKENGSLKLINSTFFGGETYKGIAKLLTDSNDYRYITDQAEDGKRTNVDTQVFEVFADDPNSPYGIFPPLVPIFPFGKCGDQNIGNENFTENDLLNSLSNFIFGECFFVASKLCQTYQTNYLYIGGDAFNGQVFNKHLKVKQRGSYKNIRCKLLTCNYALALGATFENN